MGGQGRVTPLAEVLGPVRGGETGGRQSRTPGEPETPLPARREGAAPSGKAALEPRRGVKARAARRTPKAADPARAARQEGRRRRPTQGGVTSGKAAL